MGVAGMIGRFGVKGLLPMGGVGEGDVPLPSAPEVGAKNQGEGRNAAAGIGVPRAWVTGADVPTAGGGAVRDKTRSTGCAGKGAALRSAAVEATQTAVTTACGSFNQMARVPCQARQVQVRRSKTIMPMTRTSDGRWCGGVHRGMREPAGWRNRATETPHK